MIRRLVVIGAVGAALLAGGIAAATADSTKIVPWHGIGDAGLNMSRAGVAASYAPAKGELVVHKVPSGGELDITLARNTVINVATSSPRCRTADGIGVGVRTPAGSHWKGFVFLNNFQSWEKSVCYAAIHTVVNLDTEQRVIRRVSIGFLAGVCPGLKPKQLLTAADRTAITAVIVKLSKPAKVKASNFKVAIDSKQWASAIISGKDQNGITLQPAFAVFHHGTKWTLVEIGTSGVGCEKVPIKPLTQIGGSCPG